jgi:hypothetical protein
MGDISQPHIDQENKMPFDTSKQNFPRLAIALLCVNYVAKEKLHCCIILHSSIFLFTISPWGGVQESSNLSISTLKILFICLSQIVQIFSSFKNRYA